MDTIQTILVLVVICLTTLLMVIGFQVFLMIRDIRRALKRLNSLLDDSILGGGLLRPDKLTGVFEFFKNRGFRRHGNDDIVN